MMTFISCATVCPDGCITVYKVKQHEEITIYPASELILTEDTIARGVKAIKKEAKAQSTKFRDKMMTEEAARIRRAAEEICDRIGEGEILQGAEQYLHYFYPETVSFLEYLPENVFRMLL